MRSLSFRFDDGFRSGADRSESLLANWRATYFVVSGWVAGRRRDWPELHYNGDFADLKFWQAMSNRGHDIQCHSDSHPYFSKLSSEDAIGELERSLAFIKQIHSKSRVFCYPYNDIANLDLAVWGFDAAGFDTRPSDAPLVYNMPGVQNLYRLNSWAVRERHFDRVVEALSSEVPDGAWVILAFHSLDGEGHEPWSSLGFQRLGQVIGGLGYNVETIGDVVRKWLRREPSSSRAPPASHIGESQLVA
jgi:peptidoglycan/xylan/chitin deacetylase (PgdA/CDA1 family)